MTEDGIRTLIDMIDAMRTISITGFKEPVMESQVVNKVAGLTKEEKKVCYKGGKNMNLYPFIELLPPELKKRYITGLIDSEGVIDDTLWNEIILYLVSSYKNIANFKETIKMLLKEAPPHDLDFIKSEVNKAHTDILEEMQDTILDLEDVITLNATLVKKALNEFDKTKLIKATYIVSPTVIDYFQNLYPDIKFIDMREKIGNISVEEALEANKCVVATINANY